MPPEPLVLLAHEKSRRGFEETTVVPSVRSGSGARVASRPPFI